MIGTTYEVKMYCKYIPIIKNKRTRLFIATSKQNGDDVSRHNSESGNKKSSSNQ